MSDGFAEMITAARAFFARLEKDNTKSFYETQKTFYRDEIRKPAELLADLFAEDLARHTGHAHRPKVFRIHRDVRFSKDKTPYNTHLHLLWSRPTEAPAPAWFFGADPKAVILGMGVIGLEKDALTRYRQMVDAEGATLAATLAKAETTLGAQLADWGPAPLKRVPKPFAPDHPQADLLRRKALTLRADLPVGWEAAGLLPTLNTMVPALLPVWQIMTDGLAE